MPVMPSAICRGHGPCRSDPLTRPPDNGIFSPWPSGRMRAGRRRGHAGLSPSPWTARRRAGLSPSVRPMTNAEMNIGDFWGFVVSRYAHRNARGEFIRAVRRVVSEGADPEAWMEGAGLQFAREARGLRLEYGRKMAREFGTADTGAAAVRPAMPPPWSLGGRPDGRPGAGALMV